jgi:hypothetical protein
VTLHYEIKGTSTGKFPESTSYQAIGLETTDVEAWRQIVPTVTTKHNVIINVFTYAVDQIMGAFSGIKGGIMNRHNVTQVQFPFLFLSCSVGNIQFVFSHASGFSHRITEPSHQDHPSVKAVYFCILQSGAAVSSRSVSNARTAHFNCSYTYRKATRCCMQGKSITQTGALYSL